MVAVDDAIDDIVVCVVDDGDVGDSVVVVAVVVDVGIVVTVNKKLSYCWETVRRESMPRIAEMEVEMTT